jgi:hypothetical protein
MPTYLWFLPGVADYHVNLTYELLIGTFNKHRNLLSRAEVDYFTRSFTISQTYA